MQALGLIDGVRLNLAGKFSEKTVEEGVKSFRGWAKVNELGFLSRAEVNATLAKSKVGLVAFLPAPNHIDAQPNKMFEYMSAGIPIIASHFPLWREIVEGSQCGVCVDPLSSQSIADAIQYLMEHPMEAEEMGRKGRQAVEVKYNWVLEEKKLFNLYEGLLN